MGIDINMFFMIGDFNSMVFKSKNLVRMEKISQYFSVRICLFDHLRRGQIIINILTDFSSGKGSRQFCEKGVLK